MKVFLDDNPRRTAVIKSKINVVDIETAAACITVIRDAIDEDRTIKTLFLDHDLGGKEWQNSDDTDCGMEVVRWLVEYHWNAINIERIIVHSHNTGAAEIMVDKLAQAGYNVFRIPFNVLKNILGD